MSASVAPAGSRARARIGATADIVARVTSAAVAAWPMLLIAAVALASRLRYGLSAYHDTFGSGDAHLILAKAMFISRGDFAPPPSIGAPAEVFTDPPLIALIFAGVSRAGLSLDVAPLVVTPVVSIAGLLALYAVARRAFDPTIALAGVVLVALLPRFAFDSTEPDKVAFVVSFSLLAMMLLYVAAEAAGRRRAMALAGAGLCMGLALFSHNTALLFVPVYLVTHAAVVGFRWRALVDRWVFASVLIPVAFLVAFVMLEATFKPEPFVPAPPSAPIALPMAPIADDGDERFVPAQFELYWDTVSGLARDGFRDSAWNQYFDAIREQVSSPVYVLAIVGFAAGCAIVVRQRRYAMIPLLAWMLFVTLGFAIQYPSFSHSSRYPSYVTPAFVLFAAAAIVWAARAIASRFEEENRASYALIVALPFVAFVAAAYVMHDDPGTRRLYAPHREAAEYVTAHDLLSEDAQLLYIGWPSITLHLLDDAPEVEPWLHAFGWGRVNVRLLTPAYIEANNIRYYAHDPSGGDYFDSSNAMLRQLERNFELRQTGRFCGGAGGVASCGSVNVTLYELVAKAEASSR